MWFHTVRHKHQPEDDSSVRIQRQKTFDREVDAIEFKRQLHNQFKDGTYTPPINLTRRTERLHCFRRWDETDNSRTSRKCLKRFKAFECGHLITNQVKTAGDVSQAVQRGYSPLRTVSRLGLRSFANVPVTPGGDQISDAGIDIDIVPQWSPDEEISYTLTIFGWTAIAPRL